ncbi:MAG: glycosyltransferase family 4 protein [Thermoplasmata archaeon]
MTARFAVVRGVERINFPELGIYAALRSEGFEPELLCSTRSRVTETDAGMPIRRLRLPLLGSRIAPTLVGGYLIGKVSPYRYYHQYLLGFHRAAKPVDILCPVDLGHPTSYQSIRERPFGKKVLVQCWDNIPFNWPHNRPLKEHYEAVLDGADHFLGMTEDARRALKAMGVMDDRISRINIGLNLAFFRPGPTRAETAGPLELLFVGRLQWEKGVHSLIEALDIAGVPTRLSVVGSGVEHDRLRWLLEQRRRRGNLSAPNAIRFLGPRYGEALLRLRQEADVQVAPSIPVPQWREQLNQSMLEGLACGLPAIASNSGAVAEAVADGDNGLLVPPDSPVKLAEAIRFMAEHPDERRRMGRRARERMEKEYNLERQGPLLAAIVRQHLIG